MPANTGERLAAIEADVKHIFKTVDEIRAAQKDVLASLNQAKGAVHVGKWLMPSASALLAFLSAYLGVHLPKP
jgi:hypothetical protein